MQSNFRLPAEFGSDADRFREETERFRSGAISATQFRSFRVPMGVYEQRESDTFMLRVRFPAGGVLPDQMRALATVAKQYGNGLLHVTTRQDVQVHRVLIDDVPRAFDELYAAGLSTRGGGGNTVRNITACRDAGVCPKEAFDPSPYAVALTEFMLPDPLSYQLPRKYKIAFSGCSDDCPGASVHDLGFFAKRRNGGLGFSVVVGGGLGGSSRVAVPLEEFAPAEKVHFVAEAVKRVFDKHGNRRNRNKARLRFLVDKIGSESFRKLYDAEMAALQKADLPELALCEPPGRVLPVPDAAVPPAEGFDRWRRESASPQKQDGFSLVRIPLVLGDIAADRLEGLAVIVERRGEGMVRATQRQNLVIRWVHENELSALHADLSALDLAAAEPAVLRNLVSCMGASTCKLGICLSRGVTRAIRKAIEEAGFELDEFGELRIHVSGCPNACGRHPVADIGLHGAARRVKGRPVPHYVLQLGGKLGEGETRLARGRETIPARNVPAVLVDLLDAFRRSAQCPNFEAFLAAQDDSFPRELTSGHTGVPDFEEDKNFYFDWGDEKIFSLAGRGPGECGAGVFDLIEVDLASARDALAEGRLFEAAVLAARSLLVTRGQEAQDASEALALFTRYFIDEKLIGDSHRELVERAGRAAAAPQPEDRFTAGQAEVSALVEAVRKLFDGMDPSLRFRAEDRDPGPPEAAAGAGALPEFDREVDFRGVTCPLNYVKTKMVLDRMESGVVLSVLLDEEGSRNVPESVRGDGHQVLSVEPVAGHWRVLIRKS